MAKFYSNKNTGKVIRILQEHLPYHGETIYQVQYIFSKMKCYYCKSDFDRLFKKVAD